MKEIQLSKGKVALVDDEYYEYLNQWKWSFDGRYAARTVSRKTVRMHTVIMTHNSGEMVVDHINGNKLDNRKENLRTCYHSDNSANRTKQTNNTSGYKGVTWVEKRKKWQAQIAKHRKNIFIGFFSSKEEAAKAYDEYSEKLHGLFGRKNFEK